MKLATLRDGTRDGSLVLVSRDLTRYRTAGAAAKTLQQALDTWSECESKLRTLGRDLETEVFQGEAFDETACLSPLPRAYQWLDGSAYVNHVELVRKARGAEMPTRFWTDPLMYQGGSDSFLAPRSPIMLADAAWGIDLEAEIAVVTGDVPMGVPVDEALAYVRLVMLVNDVSLRNLIPGELGKGFGFVQSKPSSSFSPVAVTPDELGAAWEGGKLRLPLLSQINGTPFGHPDAGQDMTFDFGTLIAHAARTRPLMAGTIIGSGTVSNKRDDGPGSSIADGGAGYSCIAEQRMVEIIRDGTAHTPFLAFGDSIRIEMNDGAGRSIFGAIEQEVRHWVSQETSP